MKSSLVGLLPWTRSQSHSNNKPEIVNEKKLVKARINQISESDKMKETTLGFANNQRPPSQNRVWKRPPLLRLDSEGEISTGKSFCDRAVSSQLRKLNNRLSTSFDAHTTTTVPSRSESVDPNGFSFNKNIPCHQSFKKSISDPSGLLTHQSFPPPSSSLSAIGNIFCPFSLPDKLSPYSPSPRLLGCVNIFGVNPQEEKEVMPCMCATSSSPCANACFTKGQGSNRLCKNLEKMKGFNINFDKDRGVSLHSCDKNQNTTTENETSLSFTGDSSQNVSQCFKSNESPSVLVAHKKKKRRPRKRRKRVQNQDLDHNADSRTLFRPPSCSSPLKTNSADDDKAQDISPMKSCASGLLNVKIVSPIHHIVLKTNEKCIDTATVNSPSGSLTRMPSNLEHSKSIEEDQVSDDDLVFEDSSSVVFLDDSSTKSKLSSKPKKQKCKKSKKLVELQLSDESDNEQKSISGLCFTLSLTLSEDEENDSSVDWDYISTSPSESNHFLFECEFNTGLSLDAIMRPTFSDCSETKSINKRLQNLNAKWNEFYSSASEREIPLHSVNQQKVHFADDDDLVTIHNVGDEDRAGEWQRFALERERFKRRVEEVGNIISPILCDNHRANVLCRNVMYC